MTIKRKPPRRRSSATKGKAMVLKKQRSKKDTTAIIEAPRTPANVAKRIEDTSLQLLLKGHGVQASQLADQLVHVQYAMVRFVESGTKDPMTALDVVQKLESLRRSAVEDLRRTTRLLEELKFPQIAMGAILSDDQRAFFASGSSKVLTNRRRTEGE